MPKARKRRVLFADNRGLGFAVKRPMARGLGGKSADSARSAHNVVARRLSAIDRLISRKEELYKSETSPAKKAHLKRGINFLNKLREKPFDLVALDINIPPSYSGHGQAISEWMSVVRDLKKKTPKTNVVVRSSNTAILLNAKKRGAKLYRKESRRLDEIAFADAVARELGLRQRMSLEAMEKSSKSYPIRKNLLGLKFADNETFWVALDFVSEKRPEKKLENKEFLFYELRKGRLSPNTFKAILRCEQQTKEDVRELTLNRNGKVVKRAPAHGAIRKK